MDDNKNKPAGRLEFRRDGERKFYAPDRDLLHLFHPIAKAALKVTVDTSSQGELPDARIDELVGAVAMLGRDALGIHCRPEEILRRFHARIKMLDVAVQARLFKALGDGLILAYVNAVRDAAIKPVLTEREIMASLVATSVMSLLDEQQAEQVRRKAMVSGELAQAFGEATGMYTPEEGQDGR